MRSPSYLPNLLSSLRIALAPGMLGAAYSNSKTGFLVLLGVALITDALDGFLARSWHAVSDMGRQLDHWGDALTMSLGALGVFFLWPATIEYEWLWAFIMLAGYLAIGIDRLWRRPALDQHPSWWEKGLALIPPLSLVPLVAEWTPWPFRIAAGLQLLLAFVKLGEKTATPLPSPAASRLP